jgi:hypothetical protein
VAKQSFLLNLQLANKESRDSRSLNVHGRSAGRNARN